MVSKTESRRSKRLSDPSGKEKTKNELLHISDDTIFPKTDILQPSKPKVVVNEDTIEEQTKMKQQNEAAFNR